MSKIKEIKWWFFIVYLSIKWIFRINCLNKVQYEGKIYSTNSGTYTPYGMKWSLIGLGVDNLIDEKELKKVWTIKNMIGSFRSGYKFYMTCWFKLWVYEGIQDWMRECRIWGRKDNQ